MIVLVGSITPVKCRYCRSGRLKPTNGWLSNWSVSVWKLNCWSSGGSMSVRKSKSVSKIGWHGRKNVRDTLKLYN